MADENRCEPPPEWRGKDGWHWVQGAYSVGPMLWINFSGGFWQTDGGLDQLSPERAHHMGLVYLAPVTPPATVAALVEALKHADLQLEYIDQRSPSGTTPAVRAQIGAALALYREAGR
jgi:hypothetical protein